MSLAVILLQSLNLSPDSSATQVPTSAQGADTSLSVLDLLMRGGWVMLPIFVLLFIAVFLFIERWLYIRNTSRMDPNFLYTIREMLFSGNVKGATEFCKNSQLPIARLLEKGLNRIGAPMRDIETAIENTAKIEIYNMEKNLGILSAIAAIAPMFGFLGTVTGMIRAFHDISLADNISIGVISSGIYEKMITSATGLIVGIIAHVFFTLLNAMIDRSVNRMEVTAIDFLDLLYKPARVS